MKTTRKYVIEMQDQDEFTKRIGQVIRKFSNEEQIISIEELEQWVAEDKERRRLKNKIRRLVSSIIKRENNI